MKFTVDEFRAWKHKSVTLLGMSGVGKTHLSMLLRRHHWFHYSGDYRIGTRYLDEPIMDLIKQQAMQAPFLRDLLRRLSDKSRAVLTLHYLECFGVAEIAGILRIAKGTVKSRLHTARDELRQLWREHGEE